MKMRKRILCLIVLLLSRPLQAEEDTMIPTNDPSLRRRKRRLQPSRKKAACGSVASQNGFVKAESTIQASAFCEMTGMELQDGPEGGKNVAYIDFDDSMSYDVTLYHGDGYYSFEFRISSPDGDGGFKLMNHQTGEVYLEMTNFPATGGWDVYETIRGSVLLPKGSVTLMLKATGGGWNYYWMRIKPQFVSGSTPVTKPDNSGSLFDEIVQQDTTKPDPVKPKKNDKKATTKEATAPKPQSGEKRAGDATGITNSWTGGGNTGSSWWQQAVSSKPSSSSGTASWETVASGAPFHSVVTIGANDFQVSGDIVTEPCSEGGENLSYIGDGDRLQFTAVIPSTGVYEMSVRVASPDGKGSFFIIASDSNKLIGDLTNMPATGWWQNWETAIVSSNVALTRGAHKMTVVIPQGGFNVRWMRLELLARGSSQTRGSNGQNSAPNSRSIIILQGDDLVDSQGVILEGENGRAQKMAYLDAGDWLLFNVNVPVSGVYIVDVRVNSPGGEGSFVLRNANTRKAYGGLSQLPDTGDWTAARTARVTEIKLTAGRAVPLEVVVNQGGWNLQWLSLTYKQA